MPGFLPVLAEAGWAGGAVLAAEWSSELQHFDVELVAHAAGCWSAAVGATGHRADPGKRGWRPTGATLACDGPPAPRDELPAEVFYDCCSSPAEVHADTAVSRKWRDC